MSQVNVSNAEKRVMIAVTGASGSIYAERLVQVLLHSVGRIYLTFTPTALQVVRHELREHEEGFSLVRAAKGELVSDHERQTLRLFRCDDLFAPIASGSSAPHAMIVAPCSMGSLGRIAQGISSNLVERAADVCLKQRRPLVLCVRETPLSLIHLRNMTAVAEAGAHIVPAMPAFYSKPKTLEDLVDFMVGRLLEAIGVEHSLYPPWNKRLV